MELFLHIGPHKTGTTAIQTTFADNVTALRRQGVLYPKCNWSYPAQHQLAFAMKDKVNPATGKRPNFTAELEALCRALEKSRLPRAFISSEEFFAAPPARIKTLKDTLPVASTTILAFPRRPDAFLISCHNQKTKQVGNGFATPIKQFITKPHDIAPEIDYLKWVSGWADVFGDDQVHLRAYENGSPFQHVTAALGLTNIPQISSANKSVPGVVAEAMRLAKVQDMPVDKQRKLFARATKLFADRPGFHLANPDRVRIIRAFQADNDALFKRFGQENPFKVAHFTPFEDDTAQNVNIHDLMKIIMTLL